MNSDRTGKYFAVANDKNAVKVFELEKIQEDLDEILYETFNQHSATVI